MASHTAELRSLADGDLTSRLDEARQELFNLRFQHVTGQLENHARLGRVRRDIARLATILGERSRAAQGGGQGGHGG